MTIDPISTDLTHAFSASVRAAREANPAGPATPGAIPSSPPQEVFASMLTAAQAADRLAATGRALHFSTGAGTGLSVQLTDLAGTVLGTVAPSTVLSVASGRTLD
jgi:hypothetical protein